jgi:predicted small lipoprotein YifL
MLRRTLLLLALPAALIGCGADNPRFIPPADADALTQRIEEADQAASAGECDEAATALRSARRQVDALDDAGDVAKSLIRNLKQWINALEDRLGDGCEAKETPEPSPTPEPTVTAAPTVVPTPTAAPTTAPSPTPTPTPPPEVTVEPGGGASVEPEE